MISIFILLNDNFTNPLLFGEANVYKAVLSHKDLCKKNQVDIKQNIQILDMHKLWVHVLK